MYKKKNKKQKKPIILLSIITCLITASLFINKNINLRSFFIKDGILFINKTLSTDYKNDNIKKENDNLKEQVEQLKNYETENKELKKEIEELKKITNINTTISDRTYINASVINRSFDYWNEKLIIDKGTTSEINENMAVLSNGTLIGITDDVSNYNSTVNLLCNYKFPVNISVKIKNKEQEIYGILTNYSDGLYEVTGISSNEKIEENAEVVTSGFGNKFPSGLLVGYVKNITTDNFDLAKIVKVKPNINFDDITYITVVKR